MSRNQICIVWHIEDVHDVAKQGGAEDLDEVESPLSDDEARQILVTIERQHDAEYGITWDTLRSQVSDHLREKPAAANLKHANESPC